MRRLTILTVCTANICRSPVMEILLRHRLDPRRFEVASAGVRGWDQEPMDSMAAMELMRLGHSPDGFRSRPISADLVAASSLVLTATREHRSEVLSFNPQALRRSFTLVEFAHLVGVVDAPDIDGLIADAARQRSLAPAKADIGDPYRRSPKVHRETADAIAEAVETIAARLNELPL